MKLSLSARAALPVLALLFVNSAALANPEPPPSAETPAASKAASENREEVSPESAEAVKLLSGVEWVETGKGDLGKHATIEVPTGFVFTGDKGAQKMMQLTGNTTTGHELGYIAPQDHSWFVVFQFESTGYVKDDEKDKIDADALLKQMKEGEEEGNKQRKLQGLDTLTIIGWKTPPFYNSQTNNLEWAMRLRSGNGSECVNYKTKLLGRHGVMDVVVACDEAALETVIPKYQELLKGFSFKPGETYGEYRKGDKVAEYGLTGLIVGGALFAAAKSGLLGKLIKPLIFGVIAVGAFLKRFFSRKSAS